MPGALEALAPAQKALVCDRREKCRRRRARAGPSQRKDSLVIFCESSGSPAGTAAVPFTAEQILAGRKENLDLFLLDENGDRNLKRACALSGESVQIFCRTEADEDLLPENTVRFDPEDAAARVYWRTHPVKEDCCIVLAGRGRLLTALLERAVLTNIVWHPIEYHIYGDDGSFLRHHYCLDQVFSLGKSSDTRDSLSFESGQPGDDPGLLLRAGRIILCDPEKNAEICRNLRKYYPLHGEIHAYGDVPGAVSFGSGLYTPENVMGVALTGLARAMNEIYRREADYPAPSWEELTPFYRSSNVASADHLYIKELLLGHPGNAGEAFRAYLDKTPAEQLPLWKLEHERWMRFYAFYNWTKGQKRMPKTGRIRL